MRVGIISGRYPETKFNSAINHKIYADVFGYTYINCSFPTKASNPYFNKIHYLLGYIDLFDYLVWIDDDAFFIDFDKDIMDFAPKGDTFLSICSSPTFKPIKTYISSGQFILKVNQRSKQFLMDVLATDLADVKSWWKESLGYFSNGDQDAMVYLLKEREEYRLGCTINDYKKFNSRVENLYGQDKHTILILHFTDQPLDKIYNYKKAIRELGFHSSFVDREILEHYGVSEISTKKSNDFEKFSIRIKKWLKKKIQ